MLPRSARLKRNRDFKAVYAQRRSFSCATLVLYVRFRSGRAPVGVVPCSRIGFVISKKVAKRAHDRNRLKRRLREICRHRVLPRMRRNVVVDMMFAARSTAVEIDFARLAADVEQLGRQAGLFAQ